MKMLLRMLVVELRCKQRGDDSEGYIDGSYGRCAAGPGVRSAAWMPGGFSSFHVKRGE
jgi:hypothetical protein